MNGQLRAQGIEFEQNFSQREAHESASDIRETALRLANTAIHFSFVERVPRYTPEARENDAEHSFMLALVAQEIAAAHFPELDTGLVARFSLVHDLLELKTGDIATFNISDGALQEKHTDEKGVLDEVCETLPLHTSLLLRIYEEQALPEARFVRFVDKLLPVAVDILGPGSKVMHEDYRTFTRDELNQSEQKLRSRFEKMFPEEAMAPLHFARNSLAALFAERFTPAIDYQDVLF